MPPATQQPDPSLPDYQPSPLPDVTAPPPEQIQARPNQPIQSPSLGYGKGAKGALGTAAFLATNILRGYAQGRQAAQAKQAMTVKRTTDGLHAAYDMAAKNYYSIYQDKIAKGMKPEEIEKDPEIQQAKSAVDASWAAMMKFIGQQVAGPEGQKKGKKKSSGSNGQSQSGQPDQEPNPMVGLTSNDPVEKAKAWLAIGTKVGPDVYQQTRHLASEAAQKAAAPQQAREKGEADIEFQVQRAIEDEEKQTGKPLPPERKVQISQAIRQTPPPKAPAEPKVGTIGAFVTEAAKEAGVDPNNLSAESQLGLQRAWTQAKQTGKTVGHNYVYTDKDTGEIIVVPLTTTTSGGKVEVPKVTAGGALEPAASSPATASTSPTKQSRGQDRRSADRRQVRDLPAPGEKPSSSDHLAPGAHVIGHTLAQPKAKSQQAVLDTYKKQKTLFDLLKAQTDYMNEIKADPNKASPRQDLSLVVSAVRSMNPGSVRLPAKELELEIKAGSWGDRAQRWSENASTGLLPEEQRNDLFHIVQRETTQAGQSLAKDWQQWMTNQPLPEDLKQFAETPSGDKPHPEGASDEVYAADGTTLIGHIVDGKYVALEKK